jgi:protein subunit release factor A
LGDVIDGRLQPIIDALVTHYQSEKLKQETASVG